MPIFDELLQVIQCGDKPISKEELDRDYFEISDENGLKLIHWVSLKNQLGLLKWMLKNQYDIETKTENGWKAIHFAALRNHREIIKLLVEHYCELECQTNNNETPLDILSGNLNRKFTLKIDVDNPEILYKTIGLSMGLSCSLNCTHKFCLTSISTSDFRKGTMICNGTFAKIYKIQDSMLSKEFILKIKKNDNSEHFENVIEKCTYIESEINDYCQLLNHERIVKYYGGFFRKEKWIMFLDFIAGGSLENEINKSNGLPENIIVQRCKDIISGINFLHENKIIHRNIKPSKILLDRNGRCKLIMSSLSKILLSGNSNDCKDLSSKIFNGAPHYSAPEVINNESYSFQSDIWSLGASVIHMITGKRPYHDMNICNVIYIIGSSKKIKYKQPLGFSAELEKLIAKMLNPSPTTRPTAKELLDYNVMKNIHYNSENETKLADKSFEEYYQENLEDCINIITSVIKVRKLGADIGFSCNSSCDHKFCLSSLSVGNFQKGEMIGRGYYGNTYKINELQKNRIIVLKPFNLGRNPRLIAEGINLQDKINNYRKTVKHERLVQYYGALKIYHKIYIFREFIEGNSIKNEILLKKTPIQANLVKRYTKQVLEALDFLHQIKIIHENVKTRNIYLTGNGNIKLADYGYSEFLKIYSLDKELMYSGSVSYLAPELMKEGLFDNSVDIWSLGVAVYEMLTGCRPNIGAVKISNREESSEWKSFIDKMLKVNPKERASAKSLMLSDFINS